MLIPLAREGCVYFVTSSRASCGGDLPPADPERPYDVLRPARGKQRIVFRLTVTQKGERRLLLLRAGERIVTGNLTSVDTPAWSTGTG